MMEVSLFKSKGRHCLSFDRGDGRKNSVYLNDDEILKLAEESAAAATEILKQRKEEIQARMDEQVRRYSLFHNNRNSRKGVTNALMAVKRRI